LHGRKYPFKFQRTLAVRGNDHKKQDVPIKRR
jgi:hypothetical protein